MSGLDIFKFYIFTVAWYTICTIITMLLTKIGYLFYTVRIDPETKKLIFVRITDIDNNINPENQTQAIIISIVCGFIPCLNIVIAFIMSLSIVETLRRGEKLF